MRMALSLLFVVSLTLAFLPLSQSYRDGARPESCYNMLVIHENQFAPVGMQIVPPMECGSMCNYQLSVVGRVAGEADLNTVEESNPTTYQCGQIYQLRLSSSPGSTFEGFMVEARESTDSFDEQSTIWGTWVPDPSNKNYHTVTCNRSIDSFLGPFENAATQKLPTDHSSLDLWWRAPSAEEELPQQIRFWFVAVQQRITYFKPVAGPILNNSCSEPTGSRSGQGSRSGSGSGSGSGSLSGSGSGSGSASNLEPTEAPTALTEAPTDRRLSIGAVIGITVAVVLVTLVLLVFLALGYYFCTLHLGKKQKASHKKALFTAGSEWPDTMTHDGTTAAGEVPLLPLSASQGSPPSSTGAVVMTNEGAVDAPTYPSLPSQL